MYRCAWRVSGRPSKDVRMYGHPAEVPTYSARGHHAELPIHPTRGHTLEVLTLAARGHPPVVRIYAARRHTPEVPTHTARGHPEQEPIDAVCGAAARTLHMQDVHGRSQGILPLVGSLYRFIDRWWRQTQMKQNFYEIFGEV